MEAILATITGLVGVLLSALLVWIHSDIRSLRSETNSQFQAQRTETNARFDAVDHQLGTANTLSAKQGERLARIEGLVGAPAPLYEEPEYEEPGTAPAVVG